MSRRRSGRRSSGSTRRLVRSGCNSRSSSPFSRRCSACCSRSGWCASRIPCRPARASRLCSADPAARTASRWCAHRCRPRRVERIMPSMAATKASPRLSDAQLQQVLPLIEGADSVELKLTVPADAHRAAIDGLGLDPLEAQIRQVFFLDTPDLALFGGGVVVRARRVQGKGDDSVVKLRPVIPAELPRKLRETPGFGVEVDAMPGGFTCSASLKGVPPADVRATLTGRGPLRKLLTKQQRRLFEEYGPAGIQLDDLTVLGPIFVLKLRSAPADFGRKLVAELWLYPDDSRVLELSTKCAPSEAFEVAARGRAFLAAHGVDLAGDQETKTRRALEQFAAARA